MGLPKNFQSQHTQINKRFDSLNDLNFYKITYQFRFTKNFMEKKQETEDWDIDWGVPLSMERDTKYVNTKRFSALNDDIAERKIVEWLDKQVENKVFSEYDVILTEKDDLKEILREKGLLPLINLTKSVQ